MALVVVASKPLTLNSASAAATMRDLVVSLFLARRPVAAGEDFLDIECTQILHEYTHCFNHTRL